MQLNTRSHPLGDLIFNPAARPRRSRLARPLHRMRRRRVGRIDERRDPAQPAAARQPRGQDPPHHSRSQRARRDQHGERERPLSHSQRQSVRRDAGRAQGDLGVRLPQSASAELGGRSGQPGQQPADRQLGRPAHVGDGLHRPQGRQLRLSRCAKATSCSRSTTRPAPLPRGRQDSAAGWRKAHRHDGRADAIRSSSTDTIADGGDSIGSGFVYNGKADSRRFAESTSSPTSRPAASGTPTTRTCWRPTMASRARWRGCTGAAALERSPRFAGRRQEGLRLDVPDRRSGVPRARRQESEAAGPRRSSSKAAAPTSGFRSTPSGELFLYSKGDGMIRAVVEAIGF